MAKQKHTVARILGKQIRAIRKAQRLTQEELGDRAEINPKYIGLIERGDRNPTAETLVKIARGLNVDVGDLFRFERSERITERERTLSLIMGRLVNLTPKELQQARRVLESLFTEMN